MGERETKVVQVSNIAPQTTKDQMLALFSYLGKIEEIYMYPTVRNISFTTQSRVCYIKFSDVSTVPLARHLSNTAFLDRALIVLPVLSNEIPDEYYVAEMTKNFSVILGLCNSVQQLPSDLTNTVKDNYIQTRDPKLELNDLLPYPPLPRSYDSNTVEVIRRTVMLGNVEMTLTSSDIIELFRKVGEIKYIRACIDKNEITYFLIEFTEQLSVVKALKLNGIDFKERMITVVHATTSIDKPQVKSEDEARREINEAVLEFNQAKLLDSLMKTKTNSKSKSPSPSKYKKKRRSRSRSRPRYEYGRRKHRRSRSRSPRNYHNKRRQRSKSKSRSKKHESSRKPQEQEKMLKSPKSEREQDNASDENQSLPQNATIATQEREKSRSSSRTKQSKSNRRSRSRSKRSSSHSKKNSRRSRSRSSKRTYEKKRRSRSKDRRRRRSRSRSNNHRRR